MKDIFSAIKAALTIATNCLLLAGVLCIGIIAFHMTI